MGRFRLLLLILGLLLCGQAFSQVSPHPYRGTISAAGSDCSTATRCVIVTLPENTASATVAIDADTGSWSGTLQFEGSVDGTAWIAMKPTANSSSTASSTTATGSWQFNPSSYIKIRVRGSARVSGTAAVTINWSQAVATGAGTTSNAAALTQNHVMIGQGGNAAAVDSALVTDGAGAVSGAVSVAVSCATNAGCQNVTSTGVDSASMFRLKNVGAQGPFMDFWAAAGRYAFGIGSAGNFDIRSVGTPWTTDPVGGTTIQRFTPAGDFDFVGAINRCAPTSASGTAYTCTTALGAAPVAGTRLTFIPDVDTGASPTLAVNGGAAAGIYKLAGQTAVAAGELKAGKPVVLTFDAASHWDLADILPSSLVAGAAPTACGSATGCFGATAAATASTQTAGEGSLRLDSTTGTWMRRDVNGAAEYSLNEHVITWDVIATGDAKTYIPVYFACTIYAVDVTADQAGTFAADIDRKNAAIPNTTTDKISGTDGPALSGPAQINLAHAPSSWGSTAIASGDVLNINVTTFTSVTHVHVVLRCH